MYTRKRERVVNQNEIVGYIWGAAELLRGDYKQSKYGDVVLPFTVLRRLDCVLESTKGAVQQENEDLTAYGANDAIRDEALFAITGVKFYNTSSFTLEWLRNEPNQIARNLQSYIGKEINLTRFKVEKVAQEAIKLEGGENLRNNGGSAGAGHDDDIEPLSAIIERLNDLFGTDFAEPAKKTIEAILGNLEQDDELVVQAKNNSREDFIDTFATHVTREMLKSKRENSELFKLYATNKEGTNEITRMLLDLFYHGLKG
nr:type I restriction-modification system subunit M N-terminal domain-containing protein [Bifidobacterium pseudolongum]